MKLSRILLSTVAIATVAACGNLSKVSDEGFIENPVFPKMVLQNIKKLMVNKYHNLYGLKLIKQASTMMVASSVHGQTGTTFV